LCPNVKKGEVKYITSNEKRKPDKVICVAGREFYLYRYLDESSGEYIINYPNFSEAPEYTDEGRPFVLHMQEGCPLGKTEDPEDDDPLPRSCGDCAWFYMEAPFVWIGVCMYDALKKEKNEGI